MRIQIGDIFMDNITDNGTMPYSNKTRAFLLPCLKEYGRVFTHKIDNVFKVAIGIGDVIVKNRGIKYEKHLFILLDSKIAPHHFQSFITWIRDQPMYQDDYVYANITKSTFHMIVLKFPEELYVTFHKFKEGKYSEMFSKEVLPKFFQNFPDVQKVVLKDHDYRIRFVGKLNKLFHLKGDNALAAQDYNGELELPPKDETETFNHHLKH